MWSDSGSLEEQVHERLLADGDAGAGLQPRQRPTLPVARKPRSGDVHAGDTPSDDTRIDDAALTELVRTVDPLLDAATVTGTVAQVRARMAGLGPIAPLLADPAINDILVNGPSPVWIERAGTLERTDIALDGRAIDLLIERTVGSLGLRADRTTPIVDARLADGSRMHVILPPIAVDGPYVTIRRFTTTALPLDRFCAEPVARLLTWALTAGMNLIVCGGTGTGKTTLLNALCCHIPAHERVVTVEDTAELRLPGDHIVRLETRPATPDGLEACTIRDLVRAALRMRPDRIIVGEVRGPEALDMLQAMNTGHDGSLSTCHANGPVDAVRRLETMSLMGDVGLPVAAVRDQLAGAVDLIVHVTRQPDGTRHVTSVAELLQDLRTGPRVHTVADDGQIVAALQRAPRRPTAPPAPIA
jgi:pilus assembly protein CpaF